MLLGTKGRQLFLSHFPLPAGGNDPCLRFLRCRVHPGRLHREGTDSIMVERAKATPLSVTTSRAPNSGRPRQLRAFRPLDDRASRSVSVLLPRSYRQNPVETPILELVSREYHLIF